MKLRLLPFILVPALLLSGCRGLGAYRPVESLRLVEVLGYDAPTILSAGIGGTERLPPLCLSAPGRSIPEAVDILSDRNGRGELFYADTRFLLLGQEAAESGITSLLDYIERDVHLRLDVELLLLDCPARQLMECTGADYDVCACLEAARDEALYRACGLVFDLRETALALSESGAVPVMLLRCRFAEGAPPTVEPGGCGILREGRLCGVLPRRSSELLGLLLGRAGTLLRELPESDLRFSGRGEIEVQNGDPIRVCLRVRADAAVTEAGETVDPPAVSAALEKQLRLELIELTERLRALNADVLGLRRRLELQGVSEFPEHWLESAQYEYDIRVLTDRGADWDRPVPMKGEAA